MVAGLAAYGRMHHCVGLFHTSQDIQAPWAPLCVTQGPLGLVTTENIPPQFLLMGLVLLLLRTTDCIVGRGKKFGFYYHCSGNH